MTLSARLFRRAALVLASLSLGAALAAPSVPSATPPAAKAAAFTRFLAPDAAPSVRVVLPPVDPVAIDGVKRANAAGKAARDEPFAKRLQVGLARETSGAAGTSSDALAWQRLSTGQVARWEIRSPDAKALRVGLVAGGLPDGVELRFKGSNDTVVYGPVKAAEILAAGPVYWSPGLEGDAATIEIFVPAGQPTQKVALWVNGVSHLLASPADPKVDTLLKAAASCEVNYICRAGGDAELARTGSAVARMLFTDSGTSYLCTGTVLNNTAGTFVPYFATAAHCINTQAAASTLTTYWFYETTSCTGTAVNPNYTQVGGGGQLLFADTDGDFSMLRLNNNPPSGVTYAGWDANPVTSGLSALGIHHPQGDVKKVSVATTGGFATPAAHTKQFIVSNWNSTTTGVTEEGSSGSGLFTGSASSGYRYRGGLLGGPSSCTAPAGSLYDYYSRFDLAYPAVAQYLAPTACTYAISGTNANVPSGGTSGSFTITVSSNCNWTAVSSVPWITTTSSGSGNGTISYSVAANTGGSRSGVITVGGQDFTISQAAAVSTSADNYTALWYNGAEPGWGLDLSHQGNTIFAALFTYATDGQPMWLYGSGLTQQSDGSFTGPLVRNTGPAFYAQPWTATNFTQVGTMTLRFTSVSDGTLQYTFNGTAVTKSIVRFQFAAPVPTCTATTDSRATATNYQDLWWNANETGWGLDIAHQGNVIFASLYTYDENGRDAWFYGDSVQRQADGSFSGTLYRATGSVFNASPWGGYVPTAVGTITLSFSAGDAGTLTYTVGSRTVTKSITRYSFSSTPTVCR